MKKNGKRSWEIGDENFLFRQSDSRHAEKNTRVYSHLDLDEFGGSWFCDLLNEDSIDLKENVAVRNGAFELYGTTFIPYTPVDGAASSQIQGGKFPVDATFDKMWPTCDGSGPVNGDLNRSGTHPRPDYQGNPNKKYWSPTDTDWNDDIAWFYQDYGQQITFNSLSNAINNDGRTNTYSIEVSNSDSGPWTEIIPSGSREYVTTFRFPEVTAQFVKATYTQVSTDVPYSEELEVWSHLAYPPVGSITSEVIELPSPSYNWSVLSIEKSEPLNTEITLSVINASSDQPIPGFENIDDTDLDITNISADSIRIKAIFHGNGSATPSLECWGVEWGRRDAWRDGFTGDGKCQNSINLNFTGEAGLIDLNESGSLRSEIIDIPEDNMWSFLYFNRTVPEDNFLNITVYDAGTDEVLMLESSRVDSDFSDLSVINATEHPNIYLKADFNSNGSVSPVLRSWAVNWSVWVPGEVEEHFVELVKAIPNVLYVTEDEPEQNIVDFEEYFSAPNSGLHPPTYTLEQVSDNENITLHLVGSRLDVVSLSENWTGSCHVTARCTSTFYNSTTLTNPFNITVVEVDDSPVWKAQPPLLSVKKARSSLSDYSLDEYVRDSEDDDLGFTLSVTETDITVSVNDNNRILLSHNGTFSGNTNVTATVRQLSNNSKYSNISIPMQVIENTPPTTELLSPQDGAVISDTDAVLMWGLEDPDSLPENISFTLFFGENETPEKKSGGLGKNYYDIDDLRDGVTYYWTVIPVDEVEPGNCSNGPWSFTVNLTAAVPEVDYISPANDAIINTTNLNLSWQVHNGSGVKLLFEIYFGDSRDILSKIGTTGEKFYPLEELRENITYYWKVTPMGEGIQGRSKSGVWHFKVQKNFTAVYTINGSVENDLIRVKKGISTYSFNLTINNTGNNANTVTVHATGKIHDKIIISPVQISLPKGEGGRVKVTVLVRDINAGVYTIILKLSHSGLAETVNVIMNITGIPENDPPVIPGDDETKEKKEKKSTSTQIMVAIVIGFIFLIVLFFILYRRRKRSNEDMVADLNMEIESLKTDIVHVPARGRVKATSMPHLVADGDESHGPALEKDRASSDTKKKDDTEEDLDSIGGPSVEGDADKMEGFDISKIFLPKDPTKESTAKKGVLALPPANFLSITEEDRKVPIEEVFLMTPTGILLEYYSLERDSAIGEDVLASMLSAVTSFIIDSLSMVGKDEVDEGDLSIDMGGFSVMMAKGDTLNLVAITSHEKKAEVMEQLDKGVYVLEDVFGDIMEEWDGDMSRLGGAKPYIESLVRGELDIYLKKKKLASGQTSSYIPLSRVTSSTKTTRSTRKKGKRRKDLPPTMVIEINSEKTPKSIPGNMSGIEIEEWTTPEEQPPPPASDEISLDDMEIWGWADKQADE